tara:strand:- start:862 stop:1410 length:549 start_codon:yes stop_codon:yes gene_type:complete
MKPYFEYWVIKKAIPDNLCDFLINTNDWKKGEIGLDENVTQDDKVRDSDVVWLREPFWKYSFLRLMQEANAKSFEFDITDIEPIQLTRYEAPKGHYSFHMDGDGFNAGKESPKPRKLSMSILLSDNFEGGVFQYQLGESPADIIMEKGDAIFFPSYYLHRVTPVTKGTRHSLVAWANGPSLK